ncbi:hypothetical protein [Streptomyces sp. NPDC096339]|uniref:hypothetical protein n=1 Tax=Streptomyces sp. NPDC096339 TaxID=3366086 RepID=UPI00381BFDED
MRIWSCPSGTWEFACALPHPRLRPGVSGYRGFRLDPAGTHSEYGGEHPLKEPEGRRLPNEALRVQQLFPDTVVNDPYYTEALITGRSHGQSFGCDVCPGISVDHKAHENRIANGNPMLAGFNAWGADLETVQFCCTSGHCGDCRDSQAVHSWLLMGMHEFLDGPDTLRTRLGVSEGLELLPVGWA